MFTNSIIEKANISSRIPLRSATMRFWKPISNKIPRMISATVAVQANNGKSDFGTHGSKIPVYVIKFPIFPQTTFSLPNKDVQKPKRSATADKNPKARAKRANKEK